MKKDRKLLKTILLIDIVIVSYVLLTSSIIDYRSEKKVWSVIAESAIEWSERNLGAHKKIIEREVSLSSTVDEELTDRLKGMVLLQVGSKGEAWYLNPGDGKRYYLGRPRDIWLAIHKFGLEMTDEELFDYVHLQRQFPRASAGYFIINELDTKEVYYVNPETLDGLKIDSPDQAWRTVRAEGLGISNEDIRKIEVGAFD